MPNRTAVSAERTVIAACVRSLVAKPTRAMAMQTERHYARSLINLYLCKNTGSVPTISPSSAATGRPYRSTTFAPVTCSGGIGLLVPSVHSAVTRVPFG